MEINRNQYFLAGVIILLLGAQLRVVDSYVLNEKATQILAKRMAKNKSDDQPTLASSGGAGMKKVVRPPEWAGWCLMSIGGVLILHSLAMKKPD